MDLNTVELFFRMWT